MDSDQPHEPAFRAAHRCARTEWEPVQEQQHQMEAREHARQRLQTSEARPLCADGAGRRSGAGELRG